MSITRFTELKNAPSKVALALALATTGLLATSLVEAPAYAQKKRDKKPEQSKYSEGFVAAYQPIAAQVEAGTADWVALSSQVPTLVAAVGTEDDRFIAGNLISQIGQKTKNPALQLQGLEMMLQSGKVPPANAAQYNVIAGQLAYNAEDYAKARNYLETGVSAGFTDSSPQALIAETYFREENFAEGLAYLSRMIEAQRAAGQPVDEQWIKRGLSVAYNNKLPQQVSDYALLLAANNPTPANWADVVAIHINEKNYPNPELLDLLRLAREAGALREESFYADYVDAADYRRLPGEVVAVIDEGKAAGKINQSAQYLNDIRGQAASRAETDRRDLPGILKGAQSASDVSKVVSGADLALSYGDYAAAENLYTKALTMPGADTGLVHTRLGIAQLEQGKTAEAKSHFDAVTSGTRAPIAQLWSVYADQRGGV